MKKILLITYYFPPYTGIEGVRLKSFADNLAKHGIYPVVLTRHWEAGKQQVWADYLSDHNGETAIEENASMKIYRVANKHRPSYRLAKKNGKIAAGYFWVQKILGNIQVETDTVFSFYDAALEIIKNENIELIMLSAPPFNLAQLGKKLHRKTGLPYALDFRDAYNNHLLNPKSIFNKKVRWDNYLQGRDIAKNARDASLAISIADSMLNVCLKDADVPRQIVTNGFESDLFERFAQMPQAKDRFTFTVLGNLYKGQDFQLMIDGLTAFLKQCPHMLIQFIGLSRDPEITEFFRRNLPAENLLITPRMVRQEALTLAAKSHVFSMFAWPGYSGLPSGKIYEYLGMRRNILVVPSDNDMVEDLIKETNAGSVANTPEEIVQQLSKWYSEFTQLGYVPFHGNENIQKYTREAQAAVLAEAIKKII